MLEGTRPSSFHPRAVCPPTAPLPPTFLMLNRALGTTNRTVSPIGLGLAALGRPGYINLGHGNDLEGRRSVAALEAHTHAVLDAAWEAGIRYFDAARSYGRAESFLRSWLDARSLAPTDATIGSKWGYTYTADWSVDAEVHEVKDHSVEVFERQWQETNARLGPHLDLYQIHSATLKTGVLDDAAVHEALYRIKHEHGVALGLSLSGPRQAQTLERALQVAVNGTLLFDAVQATYNVLEPSAGPMLQRAHEAGLGVIIKEAVANGRLTPRNENESFADARTVLDEQAARLHTTIDALALAAVVHEPWVDVVLSGAARKDHLASNIAALSVDYDAEAKAALQTLTEEPSTYWSTRSALSWT